MRGDDVSRFPLHSDAQEAPVSDVMPGPTAKRAPVRTSLELQEIHGILGDLLPKTGHGRGISEVLVVGDVRMCGCAAGYLGRGLLRRALAGRAAVHQGSSHAGEQGDREHKQRHGERGVLAPGTHDGGGEPADGELPGTEQG